MSDGTASRTGSYRHELTQTGERRTSRAHLVGHRLDEREPGRRVGRSPYPGRELAHERKVEVAVSGSKGEGESATSVLLLCRELERGTRDVPVPADLLALLPPALPPSLAALHLDAPLEHDVGRESPKVLLLEHDALADLAALRVPLPHAVLGPQAARRRRRESVKGGRGGREPHAALLRRDEEDVVRDGGDGERGGVVRDEDRVAAAEGPPAECERQNGRCEKARGERARTHDWTAEGK